MLHQIYTKKEVVHDIHMGFHLCVFFPQDSANGSCRKVLCMNEHLHLDCFISPS